MASSAPQEIEIVSQPSAVAVRIAEAIEPGALPAQ